MSTKRSRTVTATATIVTRSRRTFIRYAVLCSKLLVLLCAFLLFLDVHAFNSPYNSKIAASRSSFVTMRNHNRCRHLDSLHMSTMQYSDSMPFKGGRNTNSNLQNYTQSSFSYRDDNIATYPPQQQQQQSINKSSRKISIKQKHQPQHNGELGNYKVFCDLDGVLVDFEHGIRQLFPDESSQRSWQLQDIKRQDMWQRVQQADDFFEHLPWTTDGKELWNAIKPLAPDILTGCPSYAKSRQEKFAWCQRELEGVRPVHVDKAGPFYTHITMSADVPSLILPPPVDDFLQKLDLPSLDDSDDDNVQRCNVITCWSSNKHYESGPGRVLIDDRKHLKDKWERKGGIFVHHTSFEDTVNQLYDHRILK